MRFAWLRLVLLAVSFGGFFAADAAAVYNPSLGRFVQRDPAGYVDGMNNRVAHHVMHGGVDPSGLDAEKAVSGIDEQVVYDTFFCIAKLTVNVSFAWSGTWTAARKTTFKQQFIASTERIFNSNTFRAKPLWRNPGAWREFRRVPVKPDKSEPPWCDCPCWPHGFKLRLDIDDVIGRTGKWMEIFSSNDAERLDLTVHVKANPAGRPMKSSAELGGTSMYLDEADNTSVVKKSSGPGVTQTPSAHEFGHHIGLEHPGAGVPGANEYGHVGKDKYGNTVDGSIDLMGGGDGLRAFYFDRWIRALRKQQYLKDCDYRIW